MRQRALKKRSTRSKEYRVDGVQGQPGEGGVPKHIEMFRPPQAYLKYDVLRGFLKGS